MEEQIENSTGPTENVSATFKAGIVLREARERIGLSVADAAAHTKLAPRQIEALEADDYRHLPEMAFVRGFVRSYAKLLQLDAQPLLDALPQAKPVTQVSPDSVEVPFPDARSPQLQNLIWLGAALFLSVMVVAFAVWHYTSPSAPVKPEQQVESELSLPVEMQVIPASAVEDSPVSSVAPAVPEIIVSALTAKAASAPVATMPVAKLAASAVKPAQTVAAAKPTTPAIKPTEPNVAAAAKPAAAKPDNLRLTFGDESWTEVRDRNGDMVSSQLNPAGSELRLSGQGPFTLVVGRASSTRLRYKGKPVDLAPHINATSDVARLTLE